MSKKKVPTAIAEEQQLKVFASDHHKDAYRRIRNYLAGRFIGATRDEALLDEVVKCLFCISRMSARELEVTESLEIAKLYRKSFASIKKVLPGLFQSDDELLLDPASLAFVHEQLRAIDLHGTDRDPLGDAYEIFIGSAVRGHEGQFFTPKNAVHLLVSIIDPQPGERVIDPACGAGGFLNYVSRHLTQYGCTKEQITTNIYGVDKDQYLVGLASGRLALLGETTPNVYCADSLAWANEDNEKFPLADSLGQFDVVLTNPPFGARIVAATQEMQRKFELGYKWKVSKTGSYSKTTALLTNVSPQILFVERCLSLVRPGGRIGIVLPESLLSGKNYRFVVEYMRKQAEIQAVIGMPENLFKTSGKGGTHTKTCLVVLTKHGENEKTRDFIFMAETQWCGHDSRGRTIDRDELPQVAQNYHSVLRGENSADYTHLGYKVLVKDIADNVLAPRYYNPEVIAETETLNTTHELVKVGDLLEDGTIEIGTGDEVGKLAYGTGSIPFVRTSDISNWEIKIDPKHGVSDEIYASLAKKQDVCEGDILMVRDGTYLIGTCAFITKYDTKILYQSHLYKIRVKKPEKLSPYLLLAALSCEPVQRQIKAKRFTQDIIDSLGDRIKELVLPLPKDKALRQLIVDKVSRAIYERIEARELAKQACAELITLSVRPEEPVVLTNSFQQLPGLV